MGRKKKGSWGGKREGAGRPPAPPEEKLVVVPVRLSPAQVEALERLWGDNLSAGIRGLLAEYLASLDDGIAKG